jgi:hypothetical protein
MQYVYATSTPVRPGTIRPCPRQFGKALLCLVAVTMAILVAAAQVRADIHDSLVVHLRFDGDVQDYSGRANNGTIVRPGASSPYVPGIIGQAYQTQGQVAGIDVSSSSYITLGNPPDLNFDGSSDISFSWWGQYTTDAQHDDIPWLSNKDWNSGGNRGWVLASEDSSRGLRWNIRGFGETRRDIPSPYAGSGWDDGNWHHYVVTFTHGAGAMATTYQDGVAVDATDLNNSTLILGYALLPTNILQDGTGTYTDTDSGANFDLAAIDDLGIWRRALTDAEVTLIYTMGLQGISALD